MAKQLASVQGFILITKLVFVINLYDTRWKITLRACLKQSLVPSKPCAGFG